jgi:hypothetical protein
VSMSARRPVADAPLRTDEDPLRVGDHRADPGLIKGSP